MTDKSEYVAQLQDEFGSRPFTSREAIAVLDIEWIEFMDLFVCLSENSGQVQRAGTANGASTYAVVEAETDDE